MYILRGGKESYLGVNYEEITPLTPTPLASNPYPSTLESQPPPPYPLPYMYILRGGRESYLGVNYEEITPLTHTPLASNPYPSTLES
jgi:hypothetical protein